MTDNILKALASSFHCEVTDFYSEKNKVIIAESGDPFFRMITLGRNAVVSVHEKFYSWCSEWYGNVEGIFCFDAPKLVDLGLAMRPFGYGLGEIYDCFLSGCTNRGKVASVHAVDFALYENEQVIDLYGRGAFENALTLEEPSETRFAYVATENGDICGLAGASKNYYGHWCVGVDVLPNARNRGIATRLIQLLTLHLLELGETTVYPTWYSNIASRKVALRAGYLPAWVEISSKRRECNNALHSTEASSAD